ncbi:hypothetical protein [Arthrobacter sp. VKM Ac-2550]|uniref:hypothetical protein n=1 Tax=Crystallibacter permensis TaxID=1938888 RepID=UPI0029CAAE80|nr:hypothetical protein [Arthrobacter sp. VKM Ac-2550]
MLNFGHFLLERFFAIVQLIRLYRTCGAEGKRQEGGQRGADNPLRQTRLPTRV